jgi:hypothetical protein
VVLFTLLCGELPFEDKNIQNLHNKIQVLLYLIGKSGDFIVRFSEGEVFRHQGVVG